MCTHNPLASEQFPQEVLSHDPNVSGLVENHQFLKEQMNNNNKLRACRAACGARARGPRRRRAAGVGARLPRAGAEEEADVTVGVLVLFACKKSDLVSILCDVSEEQI